MQFIFFRASRKKINLVMNMNLVKIEMNDGAHVRTGAVKPYDAVKALLNGATIRMGGML